jgi:hypothetical protein
MSTCTDLQNKYNSLLSQQELLQKQLSAQNQISALLEQSASTLLCGPECQKQKISQELQQKMLDAQTNLQTAPIHLEETRKNYYVYTQGRPYYDNMLEEELTKKASTIGALLTENFNDEVTSAQTMNTIYNTDLINSKYTKELLEQYISKNNALKLKLRNKHGDILINDRKTYYEKDALETLSTWYKFWWYVYYIVVLVFIIASFLTPSSLSMIKKAIIIILLVFYPYYISYIVNWFSNLYSTVYQQIPKNVYNNL